MTTLGSGTAPADASAFFSLRLGSLEHEVFAAIFLDAQNRVIEYIELFRGTLTQTSVYPREVVRAALAKNAAAVILAHNHPSGSTQPSQADRSLTRVLKDALALIDVGPGLEMIPPVSLRPFQFFLFLLYINFGWGVFNLFPIPPLDGGSMCRELLAMSGVRNPDLYAHGVGFVLALLLAVSGGLRIAGLLPLSLFDILPDWVTPWVRPSIFRTLWYAVLAFHNYQLMQVARRRRYYEAPDDYDDDTPPWRRR